MPVGELLLLQPPRPSAPSLRHLQSRAIPELHSPFRRLQFLGLNRDVLSAISDCCAPFDALQLAMTCRDAYSFAMPRFLSDVSIGDPGNDDGPDRLKMFCNYMLSDLHGRVKFLRALRLLEGAFRPTSAGVTGRDGWGEDFSPADVLTKLLLEATNLRLLHIRDAEPLFQKHPYVYEALAQLPNIRNLSLYYIGNSSLKCMSLLRSRPAIIENGLWKDGPRPQGDITPFGPYVVSMKHLKLWECGCMLESVIERHIWPLVHTLDIGGRIAKISELAHAFPNLRRLTFFMEFSLKQESGPAVCWPELDYLQTSAPVPSFPSPVRRLQLQYPMGARYNSQNDLKTLPLMEKTNPVVLSVTISDTVPETMLARMKTSMPSLRYLELFVNEGSSGRMQLQAFADWVERNLEVMRSTSLVGLCIAFDGAGSTTALSESQRRRLNTVARQLTQAIATLAYIAVGFQDDEGSMYSCDCIWYRVLSRPADESLWPLLEPVSLADGERIREVLLDLPRE